MGAEAFESWGKGKTAKEAFQNARDQACYEHGHSGYSGTIAEKNTFKEFPVPEGENISLEQWLDWIEQASFGDLPEGYERFHSIMEKAGGVYDDKWGPAVCVHNEKDDVYVFMGYASC